MVNSYIPDKTPRHHQQGVALISAALLIPLLLIIAVVVFDLARLYLNAIYAQEVALLTAKIAVSGSPDGYALPNGQMTQLKNAPATEAGAISDRRDQFWEDQTDSDSGRYHGKTYFTEKERKVFNLAYGFAAALSPKTYFPIPEPITGSSAWEELGFRTNCSIYFRFDSDSTVPNPMPGIADPTYDAVMNQDRNRIYYVDCAVPIVGLYLVSFATGDPYRIVSRNAYAYHSGTILP